MHRAFFRDGVASYVTEPFFGMGSRVLWPTLFSGWGREFCDRAFFRDGVASFVTEPFSGMRSFVTYGRTHVLTDLMMGEELGN